jgi:hypothetical protein
VLNGDDSEIASYPHLAALAISRRRLRPAPTCYDRDAMNTNTKLTLLVFIVFFLALALATLWLL